MNLTIKNLKLKIQLLENKLKKAKLLRSKIKILEELNSLKSQLATFKDLEINELKKEKDSLLQKEIEDSNYKIEQSLQRKSFLTDYHVELPSHRILNDTDYINAISKFWEEIISKLDPELTILVRFLIIMNDTSARTLCKNEFVNNNLESLDSFMKIIHYNINNLYEHYLIDSEENLISGFVIRYKIFKEPLKMLNNVIKKAKEIARRKEYRNVKIRGLSYPISTNTYDFGDFQYKVNNLTYVINKDKNLKYEFERSKDNQIINIYKNDQLINTLEDNFIDLSQNLFKRSSKNLSYYIQNKQVILKTKNYFPQFIKKVNEDDQFLNHFYTGDIETLTKLDEKGKRYFEPYSIAFYDGSSCYNYYITSFNNWQEMMETFLLDLFKNTKYFKEIYFHNLSGFDIHFILKTLVNMKNFKVKIMLKDNKYISIKVKDKKRIITIKDSLLILPGSLNNLSKSFNINTPKEIFPRKLFENESFGSNYLSNTVPDYKYFNEKEVSLEDYNKYCELFKNKKWSLKDETLKYVNIDCIALHEIIAKFGDIIYKKWNVDIQKTPTLPSLCFRIFKMKYMKENTIPILKGIPFKDIKQSYTGGSTDAYIPTGENIWCYDINSLYPTAMKNFAFPIGKFISFQNTGKLTLNKISSLLQREIIGFLDCDITCPDNIIHPILQIRREIEKNKERTFSPVGNFKGWFHSEEIIEAIKLGYKVNIISGYLFEKGYIFNDYINDLYSIKMNADKNKDMIWRLISKNLMNSLYGRFGMDQYLLDTDIINNNEKILSNYIEKTNIENIIELGNKLLIQFLPKESNNLFYQENLDLDISINIASSVTAYSRILMYKYKNNSSYNLHYTDTDSLYISFNNANDKENFEKTFVNPYELGYLKIENPKINNEYKAYDRFYFLAPKFYVAIMNNLIDFSKTKIRGLQKAYRSIINENKIKELLNFDSKPIAIETLKWYKHPDKSLIYLEKIPYKLSITNNKRILIYKYFSPDNILLTETKPIVMKNNIIVDSGNYIEKDNQLYKEIL